VPAYFVVELETTNQAAMEPYRAAVGATITQYGGLIGVRLGLIISAPGEAGAVQPVKDRWG
jgi:uncharacterized protein (DUF1330 family)